MPAINRSSAESPAQQIADHYRSRIRAGSLEPGRQLPSTPETARDWGVAQATVRAALDILKAEGLIHSRQGRGTFVRTPVRRTRRDAAVNHESKRRALLSEEDRRRFGATEADIGLSIAEVDFQAKYDVLPASSEVVDWFGLRPADEVLRKTYTSREQSTGLVIHRSVAWVPVTLVQANPDLLDEQNEPWPGGEMHQLRTVGIEIDRMKDVVTAAMPSPEQQHDWGIESGIPMLYTRCYSYDIEGHLVSVSCAEYPADRTELAFTTQLERW